MSNPTRITCVLVVALSIGLACGDLYAAPTVINFDDVAGSQVDITTRYTGLGVTLNAIDNPFPLSGAYPSLRRSQQYSEG